MGKQSDPAAAVVARVVATAPVQGYTMGKQSDPAAAAVARVVGAVEATARDSNQGATLWMASPGLLLDPALEQPKPQPGPALELVAPGPTPTRIKRKGKHEAPSAETAPAANTAFAEKVVTATKKRKASELTAGNKEAIEHHAEGMTEMGGEGGPTSVVGMETKGVSAMVCADPG